MLHLQPVKADRSATVRERELEVGALVLRAVAVRDAFLVRRAAVAVGELAASPARRALLRAADGLAAADDRAVEAGLLGYAAVLERHGVQDAAETAYRAVLALRPGSAVVTLHTARAARKAGRREEALALYRNAAEQAGGDAHMRRLAQIGEALIAEEPLQALGAALACARRARDGEAVAIVREERARLHVAARRTGPAIRDLRAAALRYTDRSDRMRVLHRLADLFTARGDLLAAREVLLVALQHVSEAQRGLTVQRLRTVARSLGDELALRRTRGRATTSLVSLAPLPARVRPATASAASSLQRWRELLQQP
jgi:tetratricopeptide (TPR) repeat protein